MIDYARITVGAGDGGSGSGSFSHIKGKRYGKADGGDGGHGGDVYLEASRDLNTLEPFRYVKDYRAVNGSSGLSRRRKGADGADLVIKVPVGTVVRLSGGQVVGSSAKNRPDILNTQVPGDQTVFDLVKDSQKVLVARGGQGGRGNSHLKDQFGRRPKIGEKGEPGEEVDLTLELKLIADVGLIGLPNAGKSTLLSALTAAKPQIADYPFTTLEPNLGVLDSSLFMVHRSSGKNNSINYERSTINDQRLVIADIPGLIEGAWEGKGLGDLFLRHIERTKILVHLIDISGGVESDSTNRVRRGVNLKHPEGESKATPGGLWSDYLTVRGELKAYSKGLAKKKEIIVLTKADLVDKETIDKSLGEFAARSKRALVISAASGLGLDKLIDGISKKLQMRNTNANSTSS